MARMGICLAQLSLAVAALMLLDAGVASCQGEWACCIANVRIEYKQPLLHVVKNTYYIKLVLTGEVRDRIEWVEVLC